MDDDRDIEELLTACRLKPAPPGLRERILGAARSEVGAYLKWESLFKKSLVVFPLLLALLFIGDTALSRSERRWIGSFVNVSGPTRADADEGAALGFEISGGPGDAGLFIHRQRMLAERRDVLPDRRELEKILDEEL
jgi:hypothetical protein